MNEKGNVYEKIVNEIKTLIRVGVLKKEEKLLSVRAYAVERKVNPNTVAKAYAKLEADGYIAVQPKKGAYVTYAGQNDGDGLDALKLQLAAFKAAGVSLEQLIGAAKALYGEGDEV